MNHNFHFLLTMENDQTWWNEKHIPNCFGIIQTVVYVNQEPFLCFLRDRMEHFMQQNWTWLKSYLIKVIIFSQAWVKIFCAFSWSHKYLNKKKLSFSRNIYWTVQYDYHLWNTWLQYGPITLNGTFEMSHFDSGQFSSNWKVSQSTVRQKKICLKSYPVYNLFNPSWQ